MGAKSLRLIMSILTGVLSQYGEVRRGEGPSYHRHYNSVSPPSQDESLSAAQQSGLDGWLYRGLEVVRLSHTETVLMVEDGGERCCCSAVLQHTDTLSPPVWPCSVSTINQLSCFLPSTSGDVTPELSLALLSTV